MYEVNTSREASNIEELLTVRKMKHHLVYLWSIIKFPSYGRVPVLIVSPEKHIGQGKVGVVHLKYDHAMPVQSEPFSYGVLDKDHSLTWTTRFIASVASLATSYTDTFHNLDAVFFFFTKVNIEQRGRGA